MDRRIYPASSAQAHPLQVSKPFSLRELPECLLKRLKSSAFDDPTLRVDKDLSRKPVDSVSGHRFPALIKQNRKRKRLALPLPFNDLHDRYFHFSDRFLSGIVQGKDLELIPLRFVLVVKVD